MLCSRHQEKVGAGEALVHGVRLFYQQQLTSQVKLVGTWALLMLFSIV